MKQIFYEIKWLTMLTGFMLTFNVYGDTLYCPNGKQMRCLDFGAKVVEKSAVCFDSFTCSQEGFVCKSELNDLADEHEALLNKHNDLISTHNELVDVYENAVSEYERFERCVNSATTLEDAQGCN